jgi:hypothetical protein
MMSLTQMFLGVAILRETIVKSMNPFIEHFLNVKIGEGI